MNMLHVANPREPQKLLNGVVRGFSRLILRALQPGVLAIATQLQQDYDFNDIKLAIPKQTDNRKRVLCKPLQVRTLRARRDLL